MKQSEQSLHIGIVRYLEEVLPPSHRVHHIPMNPRSAVAGAREKRMGSRAGTPDLMILRPAQRVAWIEVKASKGRLSPAQREFQAWCHEQGHPHCIARSVDDVRAFLEAEQIPTRESRAPRLEPRPRAQETANEAAGRLLARLDHRGRA